MQQSPWQALLNPWFPVKVFPNKPAQSSTTRHLPISGIRDGDPKELTRHARCFVPEMPPFFSIIHYCRVMEKYFRGIHGLKWIQMHSQSRKAKWFTRFGHPQIWALVHHSNGFKWHTTHHNKAATLNVAHGIGQISRVQNTSWHLLFSTTTKLIWNILCILFMIWIW
jgi:hypothetical protein